MSRLLTFGVGVMVLFCVFITHAQAGTVNVTIEANGATLANAQVVLRSWTDADFEVATMSDHNGRVVVTNVPVGEINVYVVNDAGDVAAKYVGEVVSDNDVVDVSLSF